MGKAQAVAKATKKTKALTKALDTAKSKQARGAVGSLTKGKASRAKDVAKSKQARSATRSNAKKKVAGSKAVVGANKARTVTRATSKPMRKKITRRKKPDSFKTKTTTRKLGSGKKTTVTKTSQPRRGMGKALPGKFTTETTVNKSRSYKPALRSSKTIITKKGSSKSARRVTEKNKVTRPFSVENAAIGGGLGAAGYITYKRRTPSGKTITVRRKR